jgi:hypothetical protein
VVDTVVCVLALAAAFFIFNGTSDSYQPNLSPEELEQRQNSVELGVALQVSVSSIQSPVVEVLSNIYDCVSGAYCGPELASPGSTTLYSRLDDVDAPRLTPSQIQRIDELAYDNNCSITICGGFAETAAGIENRTIAFRLKPGEEIGPVASWRNTGPPLGEDLDYWTVIGSSLPESVRDGLTEIIGKPPTDNYNTKSLYNLIFPPRGSLTFNGDGTAFRNFAKWQKLYDWK